MHFLFPQSSPFYIVSCPNFSGLWTHVRVRVMIPILYTILYKYRARHRRGWEKAVQGKGMKKGIQLGGEEEDEEVHHPEEDWKCHDQRHYPASDPAQRTRRAFQLCSSSVLMLVWMLLFQERLQTRVGEKINICVISNDSLVRQVFQVKEIRTEHLISVPCLTALHDYFPLFFIAKSSSSSVKGVFSWDIQKSSVKTSLRLIIPKTSTTRPFLCFHHIPFLSSLSKMSFLLLIFYPFNTWSPKEPGSFTLVSIGCFSWRCFDAILVISNTPPLFATLTSRETFSHFSPTYLRGSVNLSEI